MSEWKPSVNPWLVCLAVCIPTFMEVLDTSVANVALPHMAGSLAASTDEATWVLTSYLVANAIILPASAWLGTRFGRKRFLQACIAIFTLASALCGAAASLNMLVLSRILQGLGGGALQPICQAILFESFPAAKRGPAAAMYGLAVVVAPVVGPTLGGWITDNASWRWIFYLNLPVGLVALALTQAFVEDPPYLSQRASKLDVPGLATLAIWLSAFQIMLDQGELLDWFQSNVIIALAVITVVFLVAFIWRELTTAAPLVDLSVLADRNCAAAATFYGVMGLVLFASNALLPLYLQGQMGYPAFQSGLAASPRGVGAVLSMLLIGRLISRFDTRVLVSIGFAIMGASTYWLSNLSPAIAQANVALPTFCSGLALGFIFVPLTTLATASVPQEKIGSATGITSLSRNLGGGIGISIATNLVTRGSQAHQNWLSGHTSAYDASYRHFVGGVQSLLTPHLGSLAAHTKAIAVAYHTLVAQSALLAYIDAFQIMAALCLACSPLIFLLRKAKARGGPVMAH